MTGLKGNFLLCLQALIDLGMFLFHLTNAEPSWNSCKHDSVLWETACKKMMAAEVDIWDCPFVLCSSQQDELHDSHWDSHLHPQQHSLPLLSLQQLLASIALISLRTRCLVETQCFFSSPQKINKEHRGGSLEMAQWFREKVINRPHAPLKPRVPHLMWTNIRSHQIR